MSDWSGFKPTRDADDFAVASHVVPVGIEGDTDDTSSDDPSKSWEIPREHDDEHEHGSRETNSCAEFS